jgi:hypothetical protein
LPLSINLCCIASCTHRNELREAASEAINSQISKEETADISASPLFLPQEAFSLKPEEKIVVCVLATVNH